MTTADTARLQLVIAKLSAAIDVFQHSGSKAGIGDIEVERRLGLLTRELRRLIAAETRSRDPW